MDEVAAGEIGGFEVRPGKIHEAKARAAEIGT